MPLSAEHIVTALSSTAATNGPWVTLNEYPDDFDVGVGVEVLVGTPAFTLQATFEKPASEDDNTVAAFTVPGFGSNANTAAALPYPARAVRLVIASAANPPAEARVFVQQTGH